jgi:hypothetical protein
MPRTSQQPRVGAASSCCSSRLSRRHVRAEVVGITATAMEVTAQMTTGRATCLPEQAGVVGALAKGVASTVASAATSPGSVPSQGRRRRCTATPTKKRLSCREGHAVVPWFRGDCCKQTMPWCGRGVCRSYVCRVQVVFVSWTSRVWAEHSRRSLLGL